MIDKKYYGTNIQLIQIFQEVKKMKRTVEQTALLLAIILNRSKQTRARISTKTIKALANRQQMRCMFITNLIDTLADRHDWILVELASGGFGAVLARTLEAARPVMTHKFLTEDENQGLQTGDIDWIYLEEEAFPQSELDELVF